MLKLNAILVAISLILSAVLGCNQGGYPLEANGQSKLTKQDSDPRRQLLERLVGQGKDEKLQTLLNIVQSDPDKSLRRDALNYLTGMGPDSRSISESLAKQLLIEKDADIVRKIKDVLAESHADVEIALLAAVPNAQTEQLLRIIETLGVTSAASAPTLDFLKQQLLSRNSEMVIAACNSLEKIGPAARTLLPVLISLAERPPDSLKGSTDGGRDFRERRNLIEAAVRALAAVGADESAITVLTDCLAMEPNIAAVAADALASIGVKAASALPALEQLKNRDDHGGRDIKTRLAREAASKAIDALTVTGPK